MWLSTSLVTQTGWLVRLQRWTIRRDVNDLWPWPVTLICYIKSHASANLTRNSWPSSMTSESQAVIASDVTWRHDAIMDSLVTFFLAWLLWLCQCATLCEIWRRQLIVKAPKYTLDAAAVLPLIKSDVVVQIIARCVTASCKTSDYQPVHISIFWIHRRNSVYLKVGVLKVGLGESSQQGLGAEPW